MTDSPLDTIRQLVESAIEATDDSDVHYKLRTACQLVDVVEYHHEDLLESLEDANLDDELRDELRDMGYLN